MIENEDKALRLSHDFLRQMIGWLGFGMPVLLVVGAWSFQSSVSDYYYTNMRDFFEGVLFFLSIFLIAYRPYGKDGWQDNLITSVAGGFALILAFFPTYNQTLGHVPQALVLQFVSADWSGNIHNVGSGGLFVCFAVMSLFYFTKGAPEGMSDRKKLRNILYIIAGLGIAACISIVGWGAATAPTQAARDTLNIFWPEAIALVLFGVSWLIKGGAFPFLNDKP